MRLEMLERTFAGLPPGSYSLVVNSDDHATAFATVRVDGAAVAKQVLLEPATWIVVELPGRAGPKGTVLGSIVLAGGDPGWPHSTAEDGRPLTALPRGPAADRPFCIKVRSGRYRIRFLAAAGVPELTARPLISKEMDVDVPPAGEADVKLEELGKGSNAPGNARRRGMDGARGVPH
jgi:hypothetical protein